MYALVAPLDASFDDIGITYSIPQDFSNISIGCLVEIPVRGKKTLGVILNITKECPIKEEQIEVKDVSYVFQYPLLNQAQIELIEFICKQYFVRIHVSASMFFPKNLLEKVRKNTLKFSAKPQEIDCKNIPPLTQKQEQIFKDIINEKDKPTLFWGVTGSGKTQIYMHIAKKYIDSGKQVLILIPEIILSSQILERFQEVFGEDIPLINSTLSEAKRTTIWQRIQSQDIQLILGTRSALFYPYTNLGCIIVDEEHDQSYSSDNGARFNARDIALKIGTLTGAKVIFASGTPSITSVYKVIQKQYHMTNLLEKYNS